MKWILGAFLMVLNAVIQAEAVRVEGNVSPYHHETLRGNLQGEAEESRRGGDFKQHPQKSTKLDTSFSVSRNKRNQFYDGGVAKPLFDNFVKVPTKKNPDFLIKRPHWNYLLRSTMENFGKDSFRSRQPLKPRTTGTLVNYERSDLYQSVSRFCVDSNPKPYTWESLLCSGVIDFGIGAFIETQIWADMLVCGASSLLLGDNLSCLSWLLLRLYFPQVLPASLPAFGSRLHYSLMRQGLE